MRNWKERGVVPDSEDESDPDSGNNSPLPFETEIFPNTTEPTALASPSEPQPPLRISTDIWDIPDSSQDISAPPRPQHRPLENISSQAGGHSAEPSASSPLSWLRSTLSPGPSPTREIVRLGKQPVTAQSVSQRFGLSVYDFPSPRPENNGLSDVEDTVGDTTITQERFNTRDSIEFDDEGLQSSQPMLVTLSENVDASTNDEDFQLSEISVRPLQPSKSTEEDSGTSNNATSTQISGSSGKSGTQEILQSNITMDDMIRMESEAPRRSFRPRKPIQEHPYALEMAKYNQQLRSRGMKPLRIIEESQETQRKKTQDDSQDTDFEDDSQESRIPGEDDIDNLVMSAEELNLLSSTSKPARKKQSKLPAPTLPPPVVSSSSRNITSVYDLPVSQESDDLPALDDVLGRMTPRACKRRSSPSIVRQTKRARLPIQREESLDELTLPPPTQGRQLLYIPSSSPPPIDTSARNRIRPSQSPTKSRTGQTTPRSFHSGISAGPITIPASNTDNIFNEFDDNDDIDSVFAPLRAAPIPPVRNPSEPAPLPVTVSATDECDATPTRMWQLHRRDSTQLQTPRPSGRTPDVFDSDKDICIQSGGSRNHVPVDVDSSGPGSDKTEEGSDTDSSEEEVDQTLKKFGKRLRGVLPPSYLRLSDQLEKQKQQKVARDAQIRRNQSSKKGVAQTRIGIGNTLDNFLDAIISSDEEDSQPLHVDELGQEYVQQHLVLEPIEDTDVVAVSQRGHQPFDDDRDFSDMEDNTFDWMLSASRKRAPSTQKANRSSGLKRQKTVSGAPKSTKPVPRNQPSIKSHFSASQLVQKTSNSASQSKRSANSILPLLKSKPISSTFRNKSGNRLHQSSYKSSSRKPRVSTPRLSILDIVEPNAPSFIRIAARASRQAAGNGRMSPNQKIFQMANRWDNRDVNEILHNWKSGKIKPRDLPPPKPRSWRNHRGGAGTANRKQPETTEYGFSSHRESDNTSPRFPQSSRNALSELHPNQSGHYDQSVFRNYRESDKEQESPRKKPAHPGIFISKPHSGLQRSQSPKRLIVRHPLTHVPHTRRTATFAATKRLLDELYDRTKISALRAPPTISLILPPSGQTPSTLNGTLVFDLDVPTIPAEVAQKSRRKLRKQYKPHRVDVQAPQFSKSVAPIAVVATEEEDDNEIAVRGTGISEKVGTRLVGLGAYGTQYTLNFDVFPLNENIYFHEETLLGQGLVDKATERHDTETMRRVRVPATFCFGDFNLSWCTWDDNVATEFGLLLDAISDNLARPSEETPLPDYVIIEAADFLIKYVQGAISFADPASELSFGAKFVSTLQEFRGRVDALTIAVSRRNLVVKTLTRVMISLFTAHHICKTSPTLTGESMTLEMVMIDMSKLMIKFLLSYGLRSLYDFYAETQSETARRQAIRADKVEFQAWVLLMRILEITNIPRTSFWDVLYAVLIKPEDLKTNDAARLETLWETMFSLLPLREFDSLGTVVPGIRKARSMDGWALPQKLIRQVLDIYKEGAQQAVMFNAYVRICFARCHHLIDEWGWTKCNSIVGLIFDFFGSQALSHLKNEECFKSPKFLDNLALTPPPSLAVEPNDRCFHIFLKLVALAIKKLTAKSATNEVRNLIARIMPNHNRQFLKDQDIHHEDLACLRNHHDLLCTIYWAAPPDLRPNLQLIAKLVEPAESHKEACLVNLRAWSQLARFIAQTNDDTKVFRKFLSWQNNMFRQLLDQYEAVASDMQAQFRALPVGSKLGQDVSQAKIEMFIAMNRGSIRDTLLFSARASQDVMDYAKSREAAVFALNTYQLNEVLRQFTFSPLLDWSLLLTVLGTLRMFLERSIPPEQRDAARKNDAVLLQREVADNLFSATRTVLDEKESQRKPLKGVAERDASAELLVLLCAYATAALSQIGAVKVSEVFSSSKWLLWEGPRHRLSLRHRRFLGLYMATLMSQMPLDVEPTVMSSLELWVSVVVCPETNPGRDFEHIVAAEMVRRKKGFAKEEAVVMCLAMTYQKKEKLFEGESWSQRLQQSYRRLTCTVELLSWMRERLRATPVSARKTTTTPFMAVLRFAMDQIKVDLASLSSNSDLHKPYVLFIRSIISLIRSHATDICAVDSFFYQISKDYSPPQTDPKLHVAGMISYGLRLAEGDARVVPQLFHYLYNNFKVALVNEKLSEEIEMVSRAMSDPQIWKFVVSKMLPVAVRVAMVLPQASYLLDVYTDALIHYTTELRIPDDMTVSNLEDVNVLIENMLSAIYGLIRTQSADVSFYTIRAFGKTISIIRYLWPQIRWTLHDPIARSISPTLTTAAGRLARAGRVTLTVLPDWRERRLLDVSILSAAIDTDRREKPRSERDINVFSFAGIVETDIKRAWEDRNGRLFIKGAAGVGGGQPRGFGLPRLTVEGVVEEVESEMGEWVRVWENVRENKIADGGKMGVDWYLEQLTLE